MRSLGDALAVPVSRFAPVSPATVDDLVQETRLPLSAGKGKESSVESELLLRELEEMAGQFAEGERDKLVFVLYYRQGFTTK